MLCLNCSPQTKTFLENHLILNPPIFPNYSLKENNNNNQKRSNLYSEVKFIHNLYNNINYPFINIHCYSIKKVSDKNKKLVCLYLKNISNINKNNNHNNNINNIINDYDIEFNNFQNKNLTIVYSHDINTDIGKIYPVLLDMCQNLKCDFITYDYSGYGRSEGKPLLDKFNNDLEEVVNFINSQLCIPFENLILYGKFIGCHPSIYISSLSKYCNIRGLILESPIYIDENNEGKEKEFKNYFINNYNCLKNIIAPTFLIYGKLNKMVNFEKIQFLESQINECISWYPNHGKHYDIITQYRINFYEKFKSFINYIKKTKLKIRKSIIEFKNDSIFTNESKFIINNSK